MLCYAVYAKSHHVVWRAAAEHRCMHAMAMAGVTEAHHAPWN
jgi:hypothetical protein